MFQDLLATNPFNFYVSVTHQTMYMQQQSISGISPIALSICSSQRHEIMKNEITYHTKTWTFVGINWCKKSSICYKGTEVTESNRKNSLDRL